MVPRKLSVHPRSPNYNADALKRVDKVFVDGVYLPKCYAYDMDAGWAFAYRDNGTWAPKIHGVVTVTEKTP